MAQIGADLASDWADKLAGREPSHRAAYRRCLAIANAHNIPYLETPQVAQLNNTQFFNRIDILTETATHETVSSMLGTVPTPQLRLSDLVDEYVKINAATLKTKSPQQMKKWRIGRQTAVQTFIDVIGKDIDIVDTTRPHVLAFLRDHWQNLAVQDKIKIETANKYIGHVAALLKSVCELHKIGAPDVFVNFGIKGGDVTPAI